MAWFRGDDKSHNNRKLLAVGLVGTGLHWRAVSWCASEESDGLVPAAVVPSLSPELSTRARSTLIAKMIAAGLWVAEGANGSGPSAYRINDYLTYNPSHEQLEAKRTAERSRLTGKRTPT